MKVIQAASIASLEGYAEAEMPVPVPAPSEVRIRVAACGVGYVDSLVALGRYQVKPALPHVPGNEVSGWVDAVGAEMHDLASGDRMIAQVRSDFAQQAVAEAASVHHLPEGLPMEQTAGLRINYVTALHGLRDRARLAAGERLLMFGTA